MTAPTYEHNCTWSEDEEGMWVGTCGLSFTFNDGGPRDNSFNFCPQCGNPLDEIFYDGEIHD